MSFLRKAEKEKALLEKQQKEPSGGENSTTDYEDNLTQKGIYGFV